MTSSRSCAVAHGLAGIFVPRLQQHREQVVRVAPAGAVAVDDPVDDAVE